MDAKEIKSFYDDFLASKMLKYRINGGNLRLEKAAERVKQFVHTDSKVLDVGCGIGIVPEEVAEALPEGHVWACDISEKNIWYAKQTVDLPNVTFFAADIQREPEKAEQVVTAPVDVVSLIDVIEHIPQEEHRALFEALRGLSSESAKVVMTYPSPQYQRYLMEHDPDELQIIDQVIERDELLAAASAAGYKLLHYSSETVWKRNQYIHCVLQTDDTLSPPPTPKSTSESKLINRVVDRITHIVSWRWRRYVARPYRRKKYVDDVFGDE